MKRLRHLEAEEALKEVNKGISGQHLGGRALTHKLTRLGFYWPTMLADAKAYVKKLSGQRKFIVVAIDYFTKWIEAKELAKITIKQITQFFWENVICRFGIPYIIVMDNGRQFDKTEFKEYYDDNNIELHFTSVAYPQANEQEEVVNRIILDGLKKRVERSRNTWADELLLILWAYCTTCKVTIEATPFMLAYGAEADPSRSPMDHPGSKLMNQRPTKKA
ncbi:uncharacterized protein LOC141687851 [Apium graveolens]|uniref:uncharacterized protein LOC141687851 n=1 Tax=Apium graveolens TaxID=4045 RepID=UPI003D7A43D9